MIYENITFDEYLKLEGLNSSKLKPYLKSPSYGFWHEHNKAWAPSQAMNIGTLVHAFILEGEEAANKLINEKFVSEGFPVNEKTGKPYGMETKKYTAWAESLPEGKSVIFPEVLEETVINVYKAVANHAPSADLLKGCDKRETAITWTCPNTGVKCKALVDFFGNGKAGDLKSFGRDMTLSNIERELYDRQYHLQFSFYKDGLEENDIQVDEFCAIFAGTKDDYDVGCFSMDETTLEQGRRDYINAIKNYNIANSSDKEEGLKVGQFPEKMEIGIPHWAVAHFDDIESLNLKWED